MLQVKVKRKQGNFLVDVSFAANETGVTALFGRSGAGKTSVVNMMGGLVQPDDGRIVVHERVIFDSEQHINLPPEKRRFGYVFQDGRLFPHLTVQSNLSYGMRLVPRQYRYVNFDQVVEVLGIAHLLDRRPAKLSGGEKQRVAIGRALLISPRLVLMDEPLASLDAERKGEVLPFLARLPREFSIPIIYVSHSIEEVLQLADRTVILDAGRVVRVGPTCEVLEPFRIPPPDDMQMVFALACAGGSPV